MKKAQLALTALMIGTLTVTGASFAEAEVKLEDVKIGVHFKDDHKPPVSDGHGASRPPEAHRPDEHGKPHDAPPRPTPAKAHRAHSDPHPGGPHGPEHHQPGHPIPPPPPGLRHGGRR